MISWIPYTNYEIKTIEKKEILFERIRSSVHMVQHFSFSKIITSREFEGIIANDEFRIRRALKFGYSAFLPILVCKVQETRSGVQLHVSIKFHNAVSIALLVYFTFQIPLFDLNLTSIIMILAPYVLILYLYNKELEILKDKINEVVK